jgi:hypothetical protein
MSVDGSCLYCTLVILVLTASSPDHAATPLSIRATAVAGREIRVTRLKMGAAPFDAWGSTRSG